MKLINRLQIIKLWKKKHFPCFFVLWSLFFLGQNLFAQNKINDNINTLPSKTFSETSVNVNQASELSEPSKTKIETNPDRKKTWEVSLSSTNPPIIELNINSKINLLDEHWQTLEYGGYVPMLLSFELYKPRWYWTDEEFAKVKLPIRISFDNIRETYILTRFSENFLFNNKEELLQKLLSFHWQAIPAKSIPAGEYSANLTLEIDRHALPPILQVGASTNKAWQWKQEFTTLKLILPK